MSRPDPQRPARAKLRLIHGGRPAAAAPDREHALAEETQLGREILRLPVPDANITVLDVLVELCGTLSAERDDRLERGAHLCAQLEPLGLHFRRADEALGLARAGYLVLRLPNRLVAAHAELARFHPQAHSFMMVG